MRKILLFILLFVTVSLSSQTNQYHESDKEGLRKILRDGVYIGQDFFCNIESAGLIPGDTATWNINEEWVSKVKDVRWNNDSPKRISAMNWNQRIFTLDVLDFTPFPELEVLRLPGDVSSYVAIGKGNIIIDKNTKLKELYCIHSYFEDYDLSNNIHLESLTMARVKCKPLDLSRFPNLKSLMLDYVTYFKDQKLDLSVVPQLNSLSVGDWFGGCSIDKLDLQNGAALQNIELSNIYSDSEITINFSNNQYLESLFIHNSDNLQGLDLSKNSKLKFLTLDLLPNLENLNINGCTNLENFYYRINENKLKTLDFSSNKNLKNVELYTMNDFRNFIWGETNPERVILYEVWTDQIDFSKWTNLKYLRTFLYEKTEGGHTLNLSNISQLKYLDCSFSSISSLTLPQQPVLDTLICNDNYLKFSTLPINNVPSYLYSPQEIVDGGIVEVGANIDLTSEYSINGYITSYNWSVDNLPITLEGSNGKFRVPEGVEGKDLICQMANPGFPDLELICLVSVLPGESISEHYTRQEITLKSTVIENGMPVTLLSEDVINGRATIYSVSGHQVSQTRLHGLYIDIPAPNAAGIYILNIMLDKGEKHTYKIIVR